MNPTTPDIQKLISDLPSHIRDAVNHFDWAGEVMSIGRAHNLQIDAINTFRNETMKVIVGVSPAETYQSRLQSTMRITPGLAETLVAEANKRIFHELQTRAFGQDDTANGSPEEHDELVVDQYRYAVDDADDLSSSEAHDEILDLDQEPLVTGGLHEEISHILGTNTPVVPQSTKPEEFIPSEGIHAPETIQAQNTPSGNPSGHYLELIEPGDLTGPKQSGADTSILPQDLRMGENPVIPSHPHTARDLGQYEFDQSLDRRIMENPFMAQGDTINVSPSPEEQIKEEGKFLEHLGTKDSEA